MKRQPIMFKRKFKIRKDMIPNIRPTSKASLKQICLITADGDLGEAQKLYEYMIKDMEDLPLFDPIQPSTMDQVKNGVTDVWQWVGENQDQIMNWIGFIKSMFNKNGGGGIPPMAAPASNIPTAAPIPPIN